MKLGRNGYLYTPLQFHILSGILPIFIILNQRIPVCGKREEGMPKLKHSHHK
jgi:hypothetical protein